MNPSMAPWEGVMSYGLRVMLWVTSYEVQGARRYAKCQAVLLIATAGDRSLAC